MGADARRPKRPKRRGPVRPCEARFSGRQGPEAAAGRAGNGCKLQINRRLDQNILRGANDAL